VVREAVAQYQGEAVRALVEVEAELAETTVLGDRALLTQLAGNLIANAIRHNTAGGGTAWVRTDAPGTLTVSNTGAVVPEDEIPHLFDPFQRGNDRNAPGGSGLGLSIVDSIVRAHGGSVEARPQPDGGMLVIVAIPVP